MKRPTHIDDANEAKPEASSPSVKHYYLIFRGGSTTAEKWYIFDGPASIGDPFRAEIVKRRTYEFEKYKSGTSIAAAEALKLLLENGGEFKRSDYAKSTLRLYDRLCELNDSEFKQHVQIIDTQRNEYDHAGGSVEFKELIDCEGKLTILYYE